MRFRRKCDARASESLTISPRMAQFMDIVSESIVIVRIESNVTTTECLDVAYIVDFHM